MTEELIELTEVQKRVSLFRITAYLKKWFRPKYPEYEWGWYLDAHEGTPYIGYYGDPNKGFDGMMKMFGEMYTIDIRRTNLPPYYEAQTTKKE